METHDVENKSDQFSVIHSLLRKKSYKRALGLLIDSRRRWEINQSFRNDLNHAWYLVGDALFKSGEIGGALKAFRNSLRHWPKDYDCLLAIANCHDALKRPGWSAYYLLRALEVNSSGSVAIFNLGNAYLDLGRYLESIECYRNAIQSADGIVSKKAKINLEIAMAMLRA